MKNNMFPKKKMTLKGDLRVYSGILWMWLKNYARVLVPAGVIAAFALIFLFSGAVGGPDLPGSGEVAQQADEKQEEIQKVVQDDTDNATTTEQKSVIVQQTETKQPQRNAVLARHEQYIASLRYKKHKNEVAKADVEDRLSYMRAQQIHDRSLKIKNLKKTGGDVSLLTMGIGGDS